MDFSNFSLEGKTALVSGCDRGIGFAMAEGLAEAGAHIVGTSLTLEEDGGAIKRCINELGRNFDGYICDFSDRNSLYGMINQVKENHQIDILVNNAGMILRQPIAEHSDEYWDKVIEVNQNAQFIITREFGRDMIERGFGKVIFTASLLTFQGGILVPGYAASKGAVGQLTKSFANEWAAKGVQVNAIAPGYIATENTAALRADTERSKSILDRIPAARWGEPKDFKGPVVFLASSAADYVNGAVLLVDGGWMAR